MSEAKEFVDILQSIGDKRAKFDVDFSRHFQRAKANGASDKLAEQVATEETGGMRAHFPSLYIGTIFGMVLYIVERYLEHEHESTAETDADADDLEATTEAGTD